jgi:hypothetical protein
VLAPVVGYMGQFDVEAAGDGALRLSGIDEDGRVVSATMKPRLTTGEDGSSIEVSWEVEVDGRTPT